MSKQTWSKRLSGPLSPNEIEDRFEEAARTLRRLPDDKPQGYFNVWPAIVRTTWEIMAMERPTSGRYEAGAPVSRAAADLST